MVVPVGGTWLAVLVLLMLLVAQPLLVSMAVTSSRSGHVSANVTEYAMQADMPRRGRGQQELQPIYDGEGMPTQGEEDEDEEEEGGNSMLADQSRTDTFRTEDIQVGCPELRAKRYISDGYCTSIKPIKEVVCAGNCLPIRDLPWYAEFVKVWARKKMREWQCEEDIVKRKRVNLLCRNGSTRQYRIKVVKSCKCKQMNRKHNGTGGKKNYGKVETAGEGRGGGGKGGANTKPPKKVKDRTRKKEKKRRRRQRRKKKQQEDVGERKGGAAMVVDEELDISSQLNQKQGESAVPRGRKSARKGKRGRKSETNSDTTGGEQDKTQRSEDSEKQARDQALPRSSR